LSSIKLNCPTFHPPATPVTLAGVQPSHSVLAAAAAASPPPLLLLLLSPLLLLPAHHSLVHIELAAVDLSWDIIVRFGSDPSYILPKEFFDDFVQACLCSAAALAVFVGCAGELE
jgi:hypothetical protein